MSENLFNLYSPSEILTTKLFNLYTQERNAGLDLLYSKRMRVVRAMLEAMLREEEEIKKERAHEPVS